MVTQDPRSVMTSSLYLFAVDHVLFSESGNDKIEEQCIKFIFKI